MNLRNPIKIISILKDRVCFIGSRITTLEFDKELELKRENEVYLFYNFKFNFPIKIEYD